VRALPAQSDGSTRADWPRHRAEKIRAQLAALYLIGGVAIELTASVGTAVYPVDGNELDDLIQASDRAMYRSKERLRSRHAGDSFSREALWALR
jgi:GGDEF domain-containing protein